MGTGSFKEMNLKVTGNINFDYEDDGPYAYLLFEQELKLLCLRYGLDVAEIDWDGEVYEW